ncbi:unnamed protein product, partial [Soboliphyme baturini]|uniref:GLOBIN domain-containing protein n=1 Tax=Soboliphyme baturini TaxID=241478 RepID=A0A183J8N6_9BILA
MYRQSHGLTAETKCYPEEDVHQLNQTTPGPVADRISVQHPSKLNVMGNDAENDKLMKLKILSSIDGRQRQLMKESFQVGSRSMAELGGRLFSRMVQQNPSLKKVVPSTRYLDDSLLSDDSNVINGVAKCLTALREFVDGLLEGDEALLPLMDRMAVAHVKHRLNRALVK